MPPSQPETLDHAHDLVARLMRVLDEEVRLPLALSQVQKIAAQLLGDQSWSDLQARIGQNPRARPDQAAYTD